MTTWRFHPPHAPRTEPRGSHDHRFGHWFPPADPQHGDCLRWRQAGCPCLHRDQPTAADRAGHSRVPRQSPPVGRSGRASTRPPQRQIQLRRLRRARGRRVRTPVEPLRLPLRPIGFRPRHSDRQPGSRARAPAGARLGLDPDVGRRHRRDRDGQSGLVHLDLRATPQLCGQVPAFGARPAWSSRRGPAIPCVGLHLVLPHPRPAGVADPGGRGRETC